MSGIPALSWESSGDFAKAMDLLKLRPVKFCLFLKALVGAEEMQKLMVQAIGGPSISVSAAEIR